MNPELTKIKGVWKYGQYSGGYLDQVLIVGKPRMDAARIEYFEVKSEKLRWSATSAIMNPESVDEAIKDFTKAIVQQLMQDGFLPR